MFSLSCLLALALLYSCFAENVTYNASGLAMTQVLESPYPFVFPVLQDGALAESGLFPMPSCHGFTLEEATIDQMQDALSNGNITSVELALCYLKRIYQTDGYIRQEISWNLKMCH
jgi:amidase